MSEYHFILQKDVFGSTSMRQTGPSKGWVYVVSNKAMPNIVKIGFTTKPPEKRAKELGSEGSPYPYKVEYAALVDYPQSSEQRIHQLLAEHRENKEWFCCSVEKAIAAIRVESGVIHKEVDSDSIEQSKQAEIDRKNKEIDKARKERSRMKISKFLIELQKEREIRQEKQKNAEEQRRIMQEHSRIQRHMENLERLFQSISTEKLLNPENGIVQQKVTAKEKTSELSPIANILIVFGGILFLLFFIFLIETEPLIFGAFFIFVWFCKLIAWLFKKGKKGSDECAESECAIKELLAIKISVFNFLRQPDNSLLVNFYALDLITQKNVLTDLKALIDSNYLAPHETLPYELNNVGEISSKLMKVNTLIQPACQSKLALRERVRENFRREIVRVNILTDEQSKSVSNFLGGILVYAERYRQGRLN